MSYLPPTGHVSEMDLLSSHLGGIDMLRDPGGMSHGVDSSMLHGGVGAGYDLQSSVLGGGVGGQFSEHSTDISGMYTNYMSGAMDHDLMAPHTHGIGTAINTNTALHNGFTSNFDLSQDHELSSLHHDYYYNNMNHKGQFGNVLSSSAPTNTSEYLDGYGRQHPSTLHTSGRLLSQRDREQIARAVNKGSSFESSNLGGGMPGMGRDSRGIMNHHDPYFLDDPEILMQQRQQEDYGLSSDYPAYGYNSHTNHYHSQHIPQLSHSHRPVSAPLPAQTHYNRGYPFGASTPYNYDPSLNHATRHFSHAANLNTRYPPGGFGGHGYPGGNSNNPTAGAPGPSAFVGGGMGPTGGVDEVRQPSLSSESQSYYGNETMVKELRPDFVRWFYKYEHDRKWTPFTGYDSIRIESKYRDVYRDQLANYNSFYPAACTNDESTDISGLLNQNHYHSSEWDGNRFGGNDLTQKWWHGKWQGTTVDTEFNNGGPGFPSQVRNNSAGTSLFGRGATNPAVNKEKMLHKANSASALLGGPGSINGMTSSTSPSCPPDMNKVIVVREGLYEVDLQSWSCFSTYWPGDTCMVTRGTWFFDSTWEPFPVEQAEKLEQSHMSKFFGAPLPNNIPKPGAPGAPPHPQDPVPPPATANNAPALHRFEFTDFHVDWTSPSDVFWYNAATSHKLMRSFGQKLGFSDWGHRICRGYYKPALIVDRPTEISHIVFVIHGIGQKMDTQRIVRNCSAFRDCVSSMKDKYFPHLSNAKQRAEFFPVEWRSAAKLDGDVVEAITPQKLLSLRQLLNSTAMDIMYYTSPLYRAEIQNALIDELNRIYANFVKRNPNFVMNGGKVSVMAHSLGAVITYDIMTGYLSGSVAADMSLMHHQMPRRVLPHQQGLLFTMEHFFCLGSPLSVFLALRWREPHDPALRSQVLPHHLCRRIYNVFYSSDPVAYRLEPLLNRHYVKIAPVTIHAYNAPVKPRYSEMPRERITVSKTAADNNPTNNSATSILPGPSSLLGDLNNASSASTMPTMPSLKPPTLPSIPSLPKPNLPSMPSMKLPSSPSKAGVGTGGAAPDQQGIGGWIGGNIMKLWKGADQQVSGLSGGIGSGLGGLGSGLTSGLGSGLGQFTGGTQPQQQQPTANNPPPDPTIPGGNIPGPSQIDEATFLAQQTKDATNYSTVVDEELLNVPNDLEYRLDYVLRESQFSGSGYIGALTSHTSYWNSPDAAYFVMTHLYEELIDQQAYNGER